MDAFLTSYPVSYLPIAIADIDAMARRSISQAPTKHSDCAKASRAKVATDGSCDHMIAGHMILVGSGVDVLRQHPTTAQTALLVQAV